MARGTGAKLCTSAVTRSRGRELRLDLLRSVLNPPPTPAKSILSHH